jgi:hypothetical protein
VDFLFLLFSLFAVDRGAGLDPNGLADTDGRSILDPIG